ncbi:hypothetical protein V8C26DRAFT_384484 [Trichoderma gracile]
MSSFLLVSRPFLSSFILLQVQLVNTHTENHNHHHRHCHRNTQRPLSLLNRVEIQASLRSKHDKGPNTSSVPRSWNPQKGDPPPGTAIQDF